MYKHILVASDGRRAVASDEQRRALRILVEGVGEVQRVEDNVGLLPKVVSAQN